MPCYDLREMESSLNAFLRFSAKYIFEKIRHGDDKHQEWLKETLNKCVEELLQISSGVQSTARGIPEEGGIASQWADRKLEE